MEIVNLLLQYGAVRTFKNPEGNPRWIEPGSRDMMR
jgi:hypothetical protein